MSFRAAGVLVLASTGLACSDRDVRRLGADDSGPLAEISLASFNAAIGVGLAPYAAQRFDAIVRDLPGLDADVLCLQELWQPADLERLAQALGAEYPYSHRSVRAAGGASGPACSQAEATALLSCLSDHCAAVERAGLPLCAIANCAPAFTQVATSCQQCVVANQAAEDVNHLVQICSASDGEAAAYEDQTGLLLLSRWPLVASDFLKLDSSLGDRGVLKARVERGADGSLDVYCTHLAASLGEVPYTGPYGSWQGERVQQIERFLGWVEETHSAAGSAALLGDMNCGPATSQAMSASPDAYARFVAAGFEDPYAELDGRCTFCENNPLNGSVSALDEGALIDHILLSGLPGGATRAARRVLDEPIEVDVAGSAVQTAHSDHYGIRVTVAGAGSAP